MENTQEIIMYMSNALNFKELGYIKVMDEIYNFRKYFKRTEIVEFLNNTEVQLELYKKKQESEMPFSEYTPI
jgi:hypothetical protein